jgi:hypothetical protein
MEADPLPANLTSIFAHDISAVVFGDFEVCPATPEKAGWLQGVCIETASHLIITTPEQADPRRIEPTKSGH